MEVSIVRAKDVPPVRRKSKYDYIFVQVPPHGQALRVIGLTHNETTSVKFVCRLKHPELRIQARVNGDLYDVYISKI